ncbi:MAG: 1-deoxy-D-xylulose-5-phosphate reductoisomerase [Opitutaceae bacterium]|nr:1-deoxy-D-xylulose-5-phosphate reductoisomerase [Opitutaceae bacterium]
MSSRRRIVLLGATGSIGSSTLRVIEGHRDRLELVGVVARSRLDELAQIARRFDVPHVGLYEPGSEAAPERLAHLLPKGARFYRGIDGVSELAATTGADVVLVASSGTAALRPTLAAIQAGKTIALANKEILVLAGRLVTDAARTHGVRLIPVDSEHNAIFQCLDGAHPRHIRRLVLTASGGAFRDTPTEQLAHVTPEQALAHPNWSMGPKITVDSATMANKGLEVIEARWLFNVTPGQIDVVIHPQSIVHSMVEFVDGSILAQLSPPSMTFAIQHALLHPDRAPGVVPTLDFSQVMRLEFRPCETDRYPCLALAREALAAGGTATAVYNAANEVAVAAFLARRIAFLEIPAIVRTSLGTIPVREASNLEEILAVEQEARAAADRLISR